GTNAMIHPGTFQYIKSFEDVRKFILQKTHIDCLIELGLGGVFMNSNVQVDPSMYILSKKNNTRRSVFFDLKKYKNHSNKAQIFEGLNKDFFDNVIDDSHIYVIDQEKLKIIDSWPFIYWISDEFREKFGGNSLADFFHPAQGMATSSNERF